MDPSNTTLKSRLTSMIKSAGPISVATYMDLCLHDRRHGYYATRPGLGRDFITAPEISQIFGELIGLWLVSEWRALGAPHAFSLVEVGPGRGTLMADALRASQSAPAFSKAIKLHFVEPSPVLQAELAAQFQAYHPLFIEQFDQVDAAQPVLMIANEWLDCLPVQQFVRVGAAWHERVVGLDSQDRLTFGLTAEALPPDLRPDDRLDAIELQPGLSGLVDASETLLSSTKGRILLIDYGLVDRIPRDTLRSYKDGQQIHPLAEPGLSDLTCDVDFARLAYLAGQQSISLNGPIAQSQFLLRLGAEARLNQLAKDHPNQADALYQGIRRLTDPTDMGDRFQVLCLSSPGLEPPEAF
ncbi:MAG: SAM-dependent methyltransferase [Pseudomonadota bacterium]